MVSFHTLSTVVLFFVTKLSMVAIELVVSSVSVALVATVVTFFTQMQCLSVIVYVSVVSVSTDI